MSEQSGTATATQPPAQETKPTPKDVAPQGKSAQETDWVAEARKWEQRAKENKAAADEVAALRAQMASVAQAFGVKPEADDGATLVETLQQQVAAMQHQSLVDRVARVHGITEADGLELLASAKDEEQMGRFAELLNAASAPGTPKPDASQGTKGDPNKPDPGPGIARLSAAFDEEYN